MNAFSIISPRLTRQDLIEMLTPEFLRHQAENCLRIARTCFDLTSAERLRLMANEFRAKAAEIEDARTYQPRMAGAAASSRDNDRG
jgi:hypothetical protein